jgi:hypothetical protein
VLKASPQLAMHYRDQISPLSCPELGFPMLYPPVDHCYTSSDQAMCVPVGQLLGRGAAAAAASWPTARHCMRTLIMTTIVCNLAQAHLHPYCADRQRCWDQRKHSDGGEPDGKLQLLW